MTALKLARSEHPLRWLLGGLALDAAIFVLGPGSFLSLWLLLDAVLVWRVHYRRGSTALLLLRISAMLGPVCGAGFLLAERLLPGFSYGGTLAVLLPQAALAWIWFADALDLHVLADGSVEPGKLPNGVPAASTKPDRPT